jgi:outer membrane assembly lipoprotein YfiO
MRRARTWAACAVLATVAAAVGLIPGCGGSVLPQVHDDSGRLELARRLYAKGDAALAIEALAPFSTSGSGAADVDEAVFLLGLCHLKQSAYSEAQADFERLLRDYPESDSAPSAAFRQGEALWGQALGPDFDQEFTLRALDQWMQFRRDHPTHWLAPAAMRCIAKARARLATKLYRTGDLYVKLQEYAAARAYFHDLVTEYSDTPLYGDGMIGWAISSARIGERDTAQAVLKNVIVEYKGTALGWKAQRTLSEMKHWKWGTQHAKRHNLPNEPPPPPTPSPSASGGIGP